MSPQKFLEEFKHLIINGGGYADNLEWTSNNLDNYGNLISSKIPTITTDLCEIGIYKNNLYLVFIILTKNYNKTLFDSIKNFPNIQIYGFKNPKITLYPTLNFNYNYFKKEIEKDKYLQFQFDYNTNTLTPQKLYKEYKKIKDIFIIAKVKIVNQLN